MFLCLAELITKAATRGITKERAVTSPVPGGPSVSTKDRFWCSLYKRRYDHQYLVEILLAALHTSSGTTGRQAVIFPTGSTSLSKREEQWEQEQSTKPNKSRPGTQILSISHGFQCTLSTSFFQFQIPCSVAAHIFCGITVRPPSSLPPRQSCLPRQACIP